MSAILRCSLLIAIALVLLTWHNALANNARPQRNNDANNLANALKYLEDLDTYYGDRARARFGKRAPLIQLLRQQLSDDPNQAHPIDYKAMDDIF